MMGILIQVREERLPESAEHVARVQTLPVPPLGSSRQLMLPCAPARPLTSGLLTQGKVVALELNLFGILLITDQAHASMPPRKIVSISRNCASFCPIASAPLV